MKKRQTRGNNDKAVFIVVGGLLMFLGIICIFEKETVSALIMISLGIVSFGIVALCNKPLISEKREKRIKRIAPDTYTTTLKDVPLSEMRLDEADTVLLYAEGIYERCKKLNLTEYLTHDYRPPVTKRASLASSDREELKSALNEILRDVLNFLKLPTNVYLNVLFDDAQQDGRSTAGSFETKGFYKAITVKIRPRYSPENILAILCHECTHLFMQYWSLNWNDTDMNEQRTDTVANMIGFSGIMQQGYGPLHYNTGNKCVTTTIGYISAEQCAGIGTFLRDVRKELSDERASKEREAALQKTFEKDCKNLLDTAKRLYTMLCDIDVRSVQASEPGKLQALQEALVQWESTGVKGEIQRHEAALSKPNHSAALKKQKAELEQLCEKLLMWQRAFA